MAVFRVEKTRDFTVMSNHHLRNVALSLKAKALISLMLFLPEDWDYTTKGLACICKDGVDSIGSALKELEQQGYLTRQRIRDAHGRLGDIEYIIHEKPVVKEKPAQLNKQVSRTERSNTDSSRTHLSIYPTPREADNSEVQIDRDRIDRAVCSPSPSVRVAAAAQWPTMSRSARLST